MLLLSHLRKKLLPFLAQWQHLVVPEKQLHCFSEGGWVGSYFRTLNSAFKHYQQQVKESQLAAQKQPRQRQAERQLQTHK